MSTLSLRLPELLHKQSKHDAEREVISINPLITTAVAEKLSALMTGDYLEDARCARRSRRVRSGPGQGAQRRGRGSRASLKARRHLAAIDARRGRE